jgi:hypothetical protein
VIFEQYFGLRVVELESQTPDLRAIQKLRILIGLDVARLRRMARSCARGAGDFSMAIYPR